MFKGGITMRSPIFDFLRELDEIFTSSRFRPAELSSNRSSSSWLPSVEVNETDDAYLLTFDLPGVREEDLKIEVQDGMLTVTGKRIRPTDQDEIVFERSFTLPAHVDAEKIEANLDAGVLHIA